MAEIPFKEKLIQIITDNLIILGLLIIFLSQGIITINTSLINTNRLYNDDIALKKMFTMLGIVIVFAGLISKLDGFKKLKFLSLIYTGAGLIIVVFTYFTVDQSAYLLTRFGCNKELNHSYVWFHLNNGQVKDLNMNNACIGLMIQKCLNESYLLPSEANPTNTDLIYFDLKNVTEPTTFYQFDLNNLKSSLKIGDPILIDLYLVDKAISKDKNNEIKDIPAIAVKLIEKRKTHLSVEDYNFIGIMSILMDTKQALTQPEKDSLCKEIQSSQ